MAEIKNSTDYGEAALIIIIFLSFFCFSGEPDLTDSIIYKLTGVKNWAEKPQEEPNGP